MRHLICIVIFAVAAFGAVPSFAKTPIPSSEPMCIAVGGNWVPFQSLYPDRELGEDDRRRFICRVPTSDVGKQCSDNSECQAHCLASVGAVPGEEAVGQCSAYGRIATTQRSVKDGRVDYPYQSLEMTSDKNKRLAELNANREKWQASGISNYEMIQTQQCYCSYPADFGPNRVKVQNGQVAEVIYVGQSWEEIPSGANLTGEQYRLAKTVDDIFDLLEERIRQLVGNEHLVIRYNEQYGFPEFIDYDRPDWADEEHRLQVVGFKLR